MATGPLYSATGPDVSRYPTTAHPITQTPLTPDQRPRQHAGPNNRCSNTLVARQRRVDVHAPRVNATINVDQARKPMLHQPTTIHFVLVCDVNRPSKDTGKLLFKIFP
jgi:hypothetical protein